MNLPDIFSKLAARDQAQERFLAIDIGPETVTTALWQVVAGQTQITMLGTSEDWEMEEQSPERLLSAIDTSLEKIIERGGQEPNKVIYGLQEGWVEGQAIVKKYTKTLKTITEKFEFEPIGFVVTTEAIVQLLKHQEGTPPTAILVRASETEIQVALVNLGTIIGSQTVSRSEDIGADVEEGLARFKGQEQFPSRILLTDSNLDLEVLRQDIISYNWLEKLPFLHFPKVEILEKNVAIKAVAIAGGAEAAKALGLEIIEEEEEEGEKSKRKREERFDRGEQKTGITEAIDDAHEIGFKEGADVAKEEIDESQAVSETTDEETISMRHPTQDTNTLQEADETTEPSPLKVSLGSRLKDVLPSKFHLVALHKALERLTGSRTKITVAVLAFVLTGISAAAYYAYLVLPKAEVILYVRPRSFDEELMVTIDAQPERAPILVGDNRIPGRVVETTVDGESNRQTTGTRIVGEKATGEVTIYNKTSASKRLEAGTLLVGPNNLSFTLDTEVTVASASSQETDESVTTTFGKAAAAVTAIAIGAEYNLPAGKQFTFKTLSTASYDAKNDGEMTGGTSREVQAIAQEDITQMVDGLTQDLTKQAALKLEEQEGSGNKVLVNGARTSVVSRRVSGEIGDEATTVSAKLELKVTTVAYLEADLQRLIDQAIGEAIPHDYELSHSESDSTIKDVELEDRLARVTILFTAVLIPKIDEEEVKNQLAGKYPRLAEEHLRTLPNFTRAEIKIQPEALPVRLRTFPRRTQNIAIEVRVEKG